MGNLQEILVSEVLYLFVIVFVFVSVTRFPNGKKDLYKWIGL